MSINQSFLKKSQIVHKQIRRQKLQKVFKQKRSRIQINLLLSKKLKEQLNTIESEYDEIEIQHIWQKIKQILNKNESQGKYYEQIEKIDNQNYILQSLFKKLIQAIQTIIHKFNDFNEFKKDQIQQIIACQTYKNAYNNPNMINFTQIPQEILQKVQKLNLHILTVQQIMYYCSNFLIKHNIQSYQQIYSSSLQKYSIYFTSLIIQISYLKNQKFLQRNNLRNQYSRLIDNYKQTNFYNKLNRLTNFIKKQLVQNLYRNLLKWQQVKSTSYNDSLKINKITLSSLDFQQRQLQLNIYYILGNIISDYQPVQLLKANNTNEYQKQLAYKQSNQFLSVFYLLINSFQFHSKKLCNILKNSNSQNIQPQTIINLYKQYLQLIQIQIWIMRLFLIGEWPNNITYSLNYNQKSNNLKIYQLTKSILKLSISQTFNLLQIINLFQINMQAVENHNLFKQLIEFLLISQLSMREIKIMKEKKGLNQYILAQENNLFNFKINSQNIQINFFINIIPINKLLGKISLLKNQQNVIGSHYKYNMSNKEQSKIINYVNQLMNGLINYLQSVIQTIFQDKINMNKKVQYINNQDLVELQCQKQCLNFIIECSQGLIPANLILKLPILLLKDSSYQSFICSSNIFCNRYFLSSIYLSFISNLNNFLPTPRNIKKKQKMINQANQVEQFHQNKNKNQINKIKKRFVHQFIQKLSLQHQQQEYYLNIIKMFEQCYKFYQNQGLKIKRNQILQQNSQNKNKQQQNISKQIHQQTQLILINFINNEFIQIYLYFIADILPLFNQNSKIHQQAITLFNQILLKTTDQKIIQKLKYNIQNNIEGIRDRLEVMTLWEDQNINNLVHNIFYELEIV